MIETLNNIEKEDYKAMCIISEEEYPKRQILCQVFVLRRVQLASVHVFMNKHTCQTKYCTQFVFLNDPL